MYVIEVGRPISGIIRAKIQGWNMIAIYWEQCCDSITSREAAATSGLPGEGTRVDGCTALAASQISQPAAGKPIIPTAILLNHKAQSILGGSAL